VRVGWSKIARRQALIELNSDIYDMQLAFNEPGSSSASPDLFVRNLNLNSFFFNRIMPSRTSANKRRKLAAAAQEREDMPTIGIKDEQELALETLLFGGDNLDELLGTGKKEADVEDQVVEEKEEEAVEEINYGFVIDTVGSTQGPTSPIIEEKSGGAAWIDEETEKISVNIASSSSRLRKLRATEDEKNISGQEYESRLRKQFEKINPIPSWAAATEENDDDDDGLSFLKSSGTNRSHQTPFTCDALDIQRLADANKAEPCQV
jgi:hypothetical protein